MRERVATLVCLILIDAETRAGLLGSVAVSEPAYLPMSSSLASA